MALGTEDTLRLYIGRKFRTHGGFLIESVVEAVPQSILQMIAVVISGAVSPISVFSVALPPPGICE